MESAPHPKQMIYVDFGEEIKEGYLLTKTEKKSKKRIKIRSAKNFRIEDGKALF